MIEILRLTGLKTPTEYFAETTRFDRAFLAEAIEQWHEETQGSPPGGM